MRNRALILCLFFGFLFLGNIIVLNAGFAFDPLEDGNGNLPDIPYGVDEWNPVSKTIIESEPTPTDTYNKIEEPNYIDEEFKGGVPQKDSLPELTPTPVGVTNTYEQQPTTIEHFSVAEQVYPQSENRGSAMILTQVFPAPSITPKEAVSDGEGGVFGFGR